MTDGHGAARRLGVFSTATMIIVSREETVAHQQTSFAEADARKLEEVVKREPGQD